MRLPTVIALQSVACLSVLQLVKGFTFQTPCFQSKLARSFERSNPIFKDKRTLLSTLEFEIKENEVEPISHQEPFRPTNFDRIMDVLRTSDAKKLGVWLSFFVLVGLLRSFYAVILGTFVLSYIGNSTVNYSMEKINGFLSRTTLPVKRLPRRLYALAYTCTLLAAITTITVLTVPRLNVEFQFLANLGEMENPYVTLADWGRVNFGIEALNKLEPFLLTITGESGRIFAGYNVGFQELIASKLDSTSPWSPERTLKFAKLLQFYLSKYIRGALSVCSQMVTQLTTVVYKAILSLLFSFMVVWDWPKLRTAGSALENSRLGFAFKTIGPQLSKFGTLLGKSFEVQFLIALCNTFLTTVGLLIIGLKGAWVLSFVVFMCSFIPVAGVFLSTLPMAMAALGEYGVSKIFEVIVMVLLVHAVEAYLLNPQIYSAKLKLHPIMILAVLYMTEHLAGVQGLIVAVPTAVYFMNVLEIGMESKTASETVEIVHPSQ